MLGGRLRDASALQCRFVVEPADDHSAGQGGVDAEPAEDPPGEDSLDGLGDAAGVIEESPAEATASALCRRRACGRRPAGGRRLDAELAEHALVEVLLDELDRPSGVAEDVDRADLLELRRQLGVAGDRVVDLDVDEDPVAAARSRRHPQLLLHRVGDLVDPLDHGDPGGLEAGDLLRRGVLVALDDRAGVAEAHPLHLLVVHELAGHEGDDRQPRVVLARPTRPAAASMRPPGSV